MSEKSTMPRTDGEMCSSVSYVNVEEAQELNVKVSLSDFQNNRIISSNVC